MAHFEIRFDVAGQHLLLLAKGVLAKFDSIGNYTH